MLLQTSTHSRATPGQYELATAAQDLPQGALPFNGMWSWPPQHFLDNFNLCLKFAASGVGLRQGAPRIHTSVVNPADQPGNRLM